MSVDRRELLDVLRYELNFLEQGGYISPEGKEPKAPFLSSQSCINFGDPMRRHACRECKLWEFVPESAHAENIPCYYIPLAGQETLDSMLKEGNRERAFRALDNWLRQTIARLEAQSGKDTELTR